MASLHRLLVVCASGLVVYIASLRCVGSQALPTDHDFATRVHTACADVGSKKPSVDLQCSEESLIRVRHLAYVVTGAAASTDRARCSPSDADCYRVDPSRAYGCNGRRHCSVDLTRTRFYGQELAECGGAKATRFQVAYACVHVAQLEDVCALTSRRRLPRAVAREGFLASHGYPAPYAPGINCTLTLFGGHVTLRAESLRLDHRDDCLITRDPLSGRSWCGGPAGRSAAVLENVDLVSSGSFLKVTLVTGSHHATAGGVWLYYKETPLGEADADPHDQRRVTLDGVAERAKLTPTHLAQSQRRLGEDDDRSREPDVRRAEGDLPPTFRSPAGRADDEGERRATVAQTRQNDAVGQQGSDANVTAAGGVAAAEAQSGEEEGDAFDGEDAKNDGADGASQSDDGGAAGGGLMTAPVESDSLVTHAPPEAAADATDLKRGTIAPAIVKGNAATLAFEPDVAAGALLVNNVSANATTIDLGNLSATLATTFGSISIVLLVIINAYVMRRTWASSCRMRTRRLRARSRQHYGTCPIEPNRSDGESETSEWSQGVE